MTPLTRQGKSAVTGQVGPHAVVETDHIGAGATIGEFSVVRTGVRISAGVVIHPPVSIGSYAVVYCDVEIELPGVVGGRGAVLAAGSVLTRDVEPWALVMGVPARFVRRVEEVGPRCP